MKYKESELQIRCMKWFRAEYPEFAQLMFHVRNEGNAGTNKKTGARSKAEGVVAGVADLMFVVPSVIGGNPYTGLALEAKDKKGRQSEEQQWFELSFLAAGGMYKIFRSYEEFVVTVTDYMAGVDNCTKLMLTGVKKRRDDEETAKARRELERLKKKWEEEADE